jgi:hypothetical protein
MAKVLGLYYSSYGHIEAMASAVAEGAREAGAQALSNAFRRWCPTTSCANRTTSLIKLLPSRGSMISPRMMLEPARGLGACRRKW